MRRYPVRADQQSTATCPSTLTSPASPSAPSERSTRAARAQRQVDLRATGYRSLDDHHDDNVVAIEGAGIACLESRTVRSGVTGGMVSGPWRQIGQFESVRQVRGACYAQRHYFRAYVGEFHDVGKKVGRTPNVPTRNSATTRQSSSGNAISIAKWPNSQLNIAQRCFEPTMVPL
jgi:hypothetical protein